MIIKLTQIPTDGHCWVYNGQICPYFDNEGGHCRCELWDLLNVPYKQQELSDKVTNTVCTWENKVVV